MIKGEMLLAPMADFWAISTKKVYLSDLIYKYSLCLVHFIPAMLTFLLFFRHARLILFFELFFFALAVYLLGYFSSRCLCD